MKCLHIRWLILHLIQNREVTLEEPKCEKILAQNRSSSSLGYIGGGESISKVEEISQKSKACLKTINLNIVYALFPNRYISIGPSLGFGYPCCNEKKTYFLQSTVSGAKEKHSILLWCDSHCNRS